MLYGLITLLTAVFVIFGVYTYIGYLALRHFREKKRKSSDEGGNILYMEQETDQMDVSIASLDQGELFNRSNPFRDESGRGRGRDGSGGGGGLQYGVEL